jgi:hypothetical protein
MYAERKSCAVAFRYCGVRMQSQPCGLMDPSVSSPPIPKPNVANDNNNKLKERQKWRICDAIEITNLQFSRKSTRKIGGN